jgi:hypothetical protein
MNLVIPPLFFYVVGALLVIFGGARALWLGVRRPNREIQDDVPDLARESGVGGGGLGDARASAGSSAAAKARRRHLTFGIVWVLMGIFLIVSTAGVLKIRSPF